MKIAKMTWMLLVVLVMSQTAGAAVFNQGKFAKKGCGKGEIPGRLGGVITPLCYTFAITTWSPTMIVDGQELSLESSEAAERLEVEARGDVDPVISSTIAVQLNISTDKVKSLILDLIEKGLPVSVPTVIQMAAQE